MSVVVGLATIGLVGSAAAKNPGPPSLPALEATVRDACTGRSVPGFSASLTDATGATVTASKTTASAFTINSWDGPIGMLQVSAPNYSPLGDPAAPIPGLTIAKNPGPPQDPASVNPGPIQLPGGVQIATELQAAVSLMPTGGCATGVVPRDATVTALSAKVIDADTGGPLSGLSVDLTPDPSSPTAISPGLVQIGDGTFKVRTLTAGDYDLAVSAPDYVPVEQSTMGVSQPAAHSGGTGGGTGKAGFHDFSVGTKMIVAMPKLGTNHAPVIDWVTSSSYFALLTPGGGIPVVDLSAAVHDPDPADNASLTYKWDAYVMPQLGVIDTCTLTAPTSLNTSLSCDDSPSRTAWVSFTATDQHGASATKHLTIKIN